MIRNRGNRGARTVLIPVAVVLAGLTLFVGADVASAVQTTYRWQVSDGASIAGYTTNWSWGCNSARVDSQLVVTTMNTAVFGCSAARLGNRTPAGPHDLLLLIIDSTYAQATTVSGQATGNRWRLNDNGGGGKTVRFTLGYAAGGTFTGWGSVDVVVPDGANSLYLPDMSGISGTAPAGSNLALMVTKQVGQTGKELRIHFADEDTSGDDSGEITVDEIAAALTTVGDGTNPGDAGRCPGGSATELDAFTLQTANGTDTVTAIEVSFAAGTAAGAGLVEITNDGGATVYGSAANPTDVQGIALSPSLTATTTLIQYKVRITPKTHAAMASPPGQSYPVTGTVTAITGNDPTSIQDTASATVTIDNLSPGDATWGGVTAGDGQVDLNWTNPGDGDFAEVVILRAEASISDTPIEGTTYVAGNTIGSSTVVFVGAGTSFTDTGVSNGTTYYYKIFPRDSCANYAVGVETQPQTPNPPTDSVDPGVPSATVNGCNQVTVSASFFGDDNGNSTVDFERGQSDTGPWTPVCSNVAIGNPRVCVDTGVSELTTYWYRVTFTDPDGVDPPNPQVTAAVATPACTVDDTTVVSNSVEISSCRQLTVTSVFSGDADGDGSTRVEQGPALAGPWTVACGNLTGPSPRQCIIPALTPNDTYFVRITFSDPDGVSGPNPDVLGGFTLPSCGVDSDPPTVLVLSPTSGAVVGGVERVKVQIYDGDGLEATDPVQWSLDGGPLSTVVAVNPNYSCGPGCSVYEIDIDTTAMSNDNHYLSVQVTDAAGNVARVDTAFQVNNLGGQPAGSGFLLRRSHGSQLCIDCHALATHSSQHTGAKYGNWAVDCLTCHTPHRTRNIFLVDETVSSPNSGDQTVLFHLDDRAGSTNPGSAPGDYSFLGDRSGAGNTPYDDGICEVCHTRTTHWRNDTSGGDHAHNANTRCIDCHAHDVGFSAGGGSCLDCHGSAGGAGTTGSNNLRPVNPDFGLQSHHVGDGGTMGGTLTNHDCVVCHAEGTIDAGGDTATTAQHMNNIIDLYDADDTATFFQYDKIAVASDSGITAPGDWNSTNAVWRTQTSTALDPFCLTCHDSDGAVATFNSADGGSAANPFGDAAITNNYDQHYRNQADPTDAAGSRVVDIASMVVGNPPPQGQFSRHAIRGQSDSRYTAYQNITGGNTIWEGDADAGESLFTNMGTDESGNPVWNDTSVMGCADCHTTDGANGVNGNAHGSGSEYLLKDASGRAAEGTLASLNYNCYRCHKVERYQPPTGLLGKHTDNDQDWQDKTSLTGASRVTDGKGSNIFAMACTNCHGGTRFGAIHGSSETLGVGEDGGLGTRDAYRFMNGASLRFYDPGSWSGTTVTCYTLNTGDAWGDCTQHSGGTDWTKSLQRPLNY